MAFSSILGGVQVLETMNSNQPEQLLDDSIYGYVPETEGQSERQRVRDPEEMKCVADVLNSY
jgi:hypothetical protein